MSDRKLLELAAKASGVVGTYADNGFAAGIYESVVNGCDVPWNPLHNDGQALRLAADLRLQIIPGKYKGDGCTVESQRDGIAGCTAFRDDPSAQMRAAIVVVAANIGRAQP